TVFIFLAFEITERVHRRKSAMSDHEHFLLGHETDVRPGNVLVALRNSSRMDWLERVLAKTNTERMDIVVLYVQQNLESEHTFTSEVSELFSRVVSRAERYGKPVELLVVPGSEPFTAIIETAVRLQSSLIVVGSSPKISNEELAKRFGD